MAADVSCLVRVHGGYNKDDHDSDKSTALITRDLLGGSPANLVSDAQELDLDLQVPCGWEKRLDLKSGKVYLQRCSAQNSISDNSNKSNQTTISPKLQQDFNMNFPNNHFFSPTATTTTTTRTALNLFDDNSLDLKLVSSLSPNSSSASGNYQSVCTLDKVKSALERAEKEPSSKRRSSTSTITTTWKSSSSPSYSSSSSSMKEDDNNNNYDQHQHQHHHHGNDNNKVILSSSPFAAGCPGCLSYVLIMKNNPKCPRCNTSIPLPLAKKPRIDLNMTI